MVGRNDKDNFLTGYLFLLIITRYGRLAGMRWSACISKSQRILFVSFSRTDSGLFDDRFWAVWWNFCFLDVLLIIMISVQFLTAIFPSLYYYLFCESITSASADGSLQESEWQQVSSSLQDSSKYSGWSQQSCSLDGLHSSSYFHVLQSLYQTFGDGTECTNHNWYHCRFHVPSFYQFSSKD